MGFTFEEADHFLHNCTFLSEEPLFYITSKMSQNFVSHDSQTNECDVTFKEMETISVIENPYYDANSKTFGHVIKSNEIQNEVNNNNWEAVTLIKNVHYDSDEELVVQIRNLEIIEKDDKGREIDLNDWEAVTKIENPYYDSNIKIMECEMDSHKSQNEEYKHTCTDNEWEAVTCIENPYYEF